MPDIAYPFAIEVMKGVNRAIAESEFDLYWFIPPVMCASGVE